MSISAANSKRSKGSATSTNPSYPDTTITARRGTMKRWYTRDWMEYKEENDKQADSRSPTRQIQDALENAVHRQLMSDVPYGVLLSGGLDSSVISAIAKKYAAKRIETDGASDAWWPQHSLCHRTERCTGPDQST